MGLLSDGWGYRVYRPVKSTVVQESASYAVLFTEANLPASIFTDALSSGADIRASVDSDGNTQLPVEIVWFDPSTSKAEIWVRRSLATAVDTAIYLWWGKSDATLPAVTDTYGRNAVWDDWETVFHCTEALGVTYDKSLDSSEGDGRTLFPLSQATVGLATGRIGNGVTTNTDSGGRQHVGPTAYNPVNRTDWTLQFEVNLSSTQTSTNAGLFTTEASSSNASVSVYRVGTRVDIRVNNGGYHQVANFWSNATGAFKTATFTFSSGTLKVYLDAVLQNTFTSVPTPGDNGGSLRFGADSSGFNRTNATWDEIRVAGSALSQNYLTTDQALRTDPAGSIDTTGTVTELTATTGTAAQTITGFSQSSAGDVYAATTADDFTDDFNRANGSLSNSVGWTKESGSGDIEISNGALSMLDSSSTGTLYRPPTVSGSNQYVEATFNDHTFSFIAVRCDDVNNYLGARVATPSDTRIQLYERVAGTLTERGNYTVPGYPQRIRLEVSGDTYKVSQWDGSAWNVVITRNLTGHSTGNVAINCRNSTDIEAIDDFASGLDSTVAGSAAQTVTGFSQSAAGTPVYTSAAAQTFTITQSATGSSVSGSADQTFPTSTQSAAGTPIRSGSAAQTVTGFSQSAAGSSVSGSAAQTVTGFSQSAAGTPIRSGSADQTFPTSTQSAAGSSVSGSAAQTVTGFSQSADGGVGQQTGSVETFADNFNRANESLSASSNWTRVNTTTGDILIVDNKLDFTETSSAGTLYLAPATGSLNHYVEATFLASAQGFAVIRATDQSNWIGIRVRFTGGTQTYVEVLYRLAGTLSATQVQYSTSLPRRVRLEVVGNAVKAYTQENGFWTEIFSNSTLASSFPSGRTGLIARNVVTAGVVDDFATGTVDSNSGTAAQTVSFVNDASGVNVRMGEALQPFSLQQSADAGVGAAGTAAQTTGEFSQSADGAPYREGSGEQTFNATQSAAGAQVVGSAEQTFDSFIQFANSEYNLEGSAAQTFNASQEAEGTYATGGYGESSVTIQQSAEGTPVREGETEQTVTVVQNAEGYSVSGSAEQIVPFTQNASGVPWVEGYALQLTVNPTQAASGAPYRTGAAGQTVPSFTQAASGNQVQGSAAQTVPSLVQNAAVRHGVLGSGAHPGPALTQSSEAGVGAQGSAEQSFALTQQASSELIINAAAAQEVLIQQDVTGAAGTGGAANQSIPAATNAATGGHGVNLSGAQTLELGQAAEGAPYRTGTSAQVVPTLAQSANGAPYRTGSAAHELFDTFHNEGIGVQDVPGVGIQVFNPQQTAEGKVTVVAEANQPVPFVHLAEGTQTVPGSAEQSFDLNQQAEAGTGAAGSATQIITFVSQEAEGTWEPFKFLASANQNVPEFSQNASGIQGYRGSAEQTAATFTQEAEGEHLSPAYGSASHTLVFTQAALGIRVIGAYTLDPDPSRTVGSSAEVRVTGSAENRKVIGSAELRVIRTA